MVCRITTLLVALCLFAAGESYAAPDAGSVRFLRGAERVFDPFTYAPSPEQQAWMREHYARMRTYAPYFDERLRWFPGAWTYKDAYAIYPGSDLASGADRFILRDGAGRRLYIPFGCANGRCPQFAGDIGDPAFRSAWIEEARDQLAAGYRGLYIDDVNAFLQVSDGSGRLVAPRDPRTGRTMTWRDWKGYLADFMQEVRAAFPHVEIVHNAVWFAGDDDPDVARQLGAADVINLERGINDGGLTGGTGRFALRTLLDMVDRLHARGIDVVFDSNARTDEERMYGLAGYFLVSNGRDFLGSYSGGFPDDWWSGYDTRLGAPEGPRYDWQGLLRRDFFGGVALLNEPGAPERTVEVGPGYRDLQGRPVTRVTLRAASGAVLVREHVGPAAIWTSTFVAAARRLRGRARAAGDRHRVRVAGRVRGARAGRVVLELQRRRAGRWRPARRAAAALRGRARFSRVVGGVGAGRYRVAARYLGHGAAQPSRSGFRRFSIIG